MCVSVNKGQLQHRCGGRLLLRMVSDVLMNSKHVVSAAFIRVYVYCRDAYVIRGGRIVLLLGV